METLKNEFLTIEVKEDGAELCSIRTQEREYLWQANPKFWARHSPVLFPIVGRVWDDVYRVAGREYHLGQHGFARDRKFTLVSKTEDTVWYALESDAESQEKYPYAFRLEIGYRLHGKSVDVIWRVTNPAETEMYFQIGAHPAFYWPEFEGSDEAKYEEQGLLGYFRLSKGGKAVGNSLKRSTITEKGCVDPLAAGEVTVEEDGMLPLNFALFSKDALVLEDSQVDTVELLHTDKRPYLTVAFDAPLVGLWSSPGKQAPFVCIEPWYGRCDSVRFAGEYAEREHVNRLGAKESFEVHYTITVE